MAGKRYLVTAEEMKRYDSNTMEYFNMPSLVLMERAALVMAWEIEKRCSCRKSGKVLIAAGCGNNGGDGIAVGRILMQRGYTVDVILCGSRAVCSKETSVQIEIIEKYGCPVQSKIENWEYDIIVDAIFGIGLSRDIEGSYIQIIENINRSGAFVCAADVASGINADTGEVMGTAVKADLTVTFAFRKLGHVLYPGCEYAGAVVCADIGITEHSFLGVCPGVYDYEAGADELLPKRAADGNKGTFGKVLVIAGSLNMSGACELCARSAYRIGAGMVKVITPEENRVIVQKNIPEALLRTYSQKEKEGLPYEGIREDMNWADCIVIGPGLGKSRQAYELLETVLSSLLPEVGKTVLVDADGLNLIAENEELRKLLESKGNFNSGGKAEIGGNRIVLTPHLAEFARLYGCTAAEAKKNILSAPGELAQRYGCIVVCKDSRTVVAENAAPAVYINTTGNDGMATAGMGDVLSGIIGGLLAQGMQAGEAARLGVYIHGAAGDIAAAERGRYFLMAGDMIEQLGFINRERKDGNSREK